MPRTHDLRCRTCGATSRDVLLRDSDGDEKPCAAADCKGVMTITWEFPSTRITDAEGFVPVDLDGVHYGTREALNARKKELAESLGVPVDRIVVEGNSRHDRNARADDALQRHVESLRRAGYDEQSWNQRKQLVREDPALRARYTPRTQRAQQRQ